MYNSGRIKQLVDFIESNKTVGDKNKLTTLVKDEFSLEKKGSLYFCDDFAIRFCWNGKDNKKTISNTVLALSKIKLFDDRPLMLCIVTRETSHLLLINSTFLKKVSHSSQNLRIDNIRGCINSSDILMNYNSIENSPENFEELFAFHQEFTFEENLERLVEITNGIVGRTQKFDVTDDLKSQIMQSITLAQEFAASNEYKDLLSDLDNRVANVAESIVVAASIKNVNIRGRLIEFLITDGDPAVKNQVIAALKNDTPLPNFTTADNLGDFSKKYPKYNTETDIKTKLLYTGSAPKAYNVDKILQFLSTEKAVYLLYIIGVEQNGKLTTRLCSLFDERLIDTTLVQQHWSGRNSRGETQFSGNKLKEILNQPASISINADKARIFVETLISK